MKIKKLYFGVQLFSIALSTILLIADTSIDDFSNLNLTSINTIKYPLDYSELAAILTTAQKNNLKVSIAGKKHSQGGHTFYDNAIVIDTRNLNKIIDLDKETNVITVQTGVTWKQIQQHINQYGLSIKVMQYANVLSIGGALSVNANGIDPHNGPLIETIKSIKIMNSNGEILRACRTENAELFKLAIGGYGLFGIIIEAEIELTENFLYERNCRFLPFDQYANYLNNQIKDNPKIGLHHAQMCIDPYNKKKIFSGLFIADYLKLSETEKYPATDKVYTLNSEPNSKLHKLLFNLIRQSKPLQLIRNFADSLKFIKKEIISRNNALSVPIQYLYYNSPKETDLLQEYFIPVDKITVFLTYIEKLVLEYNINLLYLDLRFIRKNIESFISYTDTDRVGVVLFFNHQKSAQELNKTKSWSCKLINKAISLSGTYYLPIQLYACKHMIEKAYPKIPDFFNLKKLYDPHELFFNHFYKKYA